MCALDPLAPPRLEQLSRYSDVEAWHVEIGLEAWPVPPGRRLTGRDSWNGKALVVPIDGTNERSVGEVELVERLRRAHPATRAYWTAGRGHAPEIWRPWVLRPNLRENWLLKLDSEVRRGEADIETNTKGLPDVLWWSFGETDLRCVEYKGPSPSNPDRIDSISKEQDAGYRFGTAASQARPDSLRCRPLGSHPGGKSLLQDQANASRRA